MKSTDSRDDFHDIDTMIIWKLKNYRRTYVNHRDKYIWSMNMTKSLYACEYISYLFIQI